MRARTFIFWSAFFLIAPIGGCHLDSAQRVAVVEQQVEMLQERSAQIEAIADGAERLLETAQTKLADPNLSNELLTEWRDRATEAQAKLAQAREVKSQIDAVLAQWQQQLADAGQVTGPGDELQLLGHGVAAVGAHVPSPWNAYLSLIGGIITAAGGVVVGWKKAEAEKAKAAGVQKDLTNVIHSVDSLLDSHLIADEDGAKALLADRQGTATAANVKIIKNG
jgi:hypothetical protein